MDNVLTVVLAGGAGERLYPLTRDRAKPAVPFGGIHRIIDFTLSNCINSGCFRTLVMVQYKSSSLTRHIRTGWNPLFRPERGEFLEVIPPQMRVNDNWYLGTADAIFQNLYSIEQSQPREVLILSSDHIYKMDYRKMLRHHREVEADVTVAAIQVPLKEACRFGVLEIDGEGRVVGFEEKPENPRHLPHDQSQSLASMGIYIFNTDVLRRAVLEDAERDSCHDFGKDILPSLIGSHQVHAYKFQDENRKSMQYWRDVGTIDSYYEANMDLVSVDPQLNLYDDSWPIRSSVPSLPPAKFVFGDIGVRAGMAIDSLVSAGCIVSGGSVKRCILSPRIRINSYSQIEDSILFEGVEVGRHCRIRGAIIEKHVNIPDYTIIGYDQEADARHFSVTPKGVSVVERRDELHVPQTEHAI